MIQLNFTKDEMTTFLQKRGYKLETIQTWSSYNTYHNQVENSYKNVLVAFKGTFDVFNDSDGSYRDLSVEKYKLENVFKDEVKHSLLNLS
jgi:hypothetical protein